MDLPNPEPVVVEIIETGREESIIECQQFREFERIVGPAVHLGGKRDDPSWLLRLPAH